jgi:hypothetical protein
MAVLCSRFRIEGFWKIEEPEIAREFAGRDYARCPNFDQLPGRVAVS